MFATVMTAKGRSPNNATGCVRILMREFAEMSGQCPLGSSSVKLMRNVNRLGGLLLIPLMGLGLAIATRPSTAPGITLTSTYCPPTIGYGSGGSTVQMWQGLLGPPSFAPLQDST